MSTNYREIITVTVDHELPKQFSSFLSTKIAEILRHELGKKNHKLGVVRIGAWRQSDLDCAIWNLAEKIKDTASEAVDERIR